MWPAFSRLGLHAKLSIGGGPHMKITVFSAGFGRCASIISRLTKPTEYFHG